MSIHPQIKLTIINILILTLITKKCKIKTVTSKVKIALFTDTTPSLTYWEKQITVTFEYYTCCRI